MRIKRGYGVRLHVCNLSLLDRKPLFVVRQAVQLHHEGAVSLEKGPAIWIVDLVWVALDVGHQLIEARLFAETPGLFTQHDRLLVQGFCLWRQGGS